MRLFPLLLTWVVLFLSACDFTPSGSYYEEINPNPDINFTIELNNSTDTLFARGTVKMSLGLGYPGKQLMYYQVLIDGKVVGQSNGNNFLSPLDTKAYSDGPHEIKVLVATSTGTNSMADKAGAEMLQVYRTWVLMVDNAPPTPVAIIRVAVEDGTLKVEWEKYKRRDIKNFIVSRRYSNGGTVYSRTLSSNVTSWTDASYLGGPAYYTVTVVNPEGHLAESQMATIDTPVPAFLAYEYQNGNDLKLTFSSSKLYRNFGRYRINYLNEPTPLVEKSGIQDTVFTIPNVPFGADLNLVFSVVAKDQEFFYYRIGQTFTVKGYGHENAIGPYTVSHFNPHYNLYYDFRSPTASALDATSLQVKHQRIVQDGFRELAPGGQYLYALSGSLLSQLDPSTLQTLSSYNLKDIIPGLQYTELYIKVSDNNRVLVYSRSYVTREDHIYIVNMHTRQVELTHEQAHLNWAYYSISPDGNMVTGFNFVFRKQPDGSWQKKQVPPGSFGSIQYHPTAPVYFTVRSGTFYIYSTENDAILKTITLGENVTPGYFDHETGYLVAFGNSTLYIYDINRNLVLKEVKLAQGNNGAVFFKNKLFTKGYYAQILL